jgi:hypothetical protein
MRGDRLDVLQRLIIRSVSQQDARVAVHVEGPERESNVIRFTFEDLHYANEQRLLLERWMSKLTLLTYVRGADGQSVLLDDEETFYASFAADLAP